MTHVEENKNKIVRQTSVSSWEQKDTDYETFPGPSIFFPSIIFSIKDATALLLHFPHSHNASFGEVTSATYTDFVSQGKRSQASPLWGTARALWDFTDPWKLWPVGLGPAAPCFGGLLCWDDSKIVKVFVS